MIAASVLMLAPFGTQSAVAASKAAPPHSAEQVLASKAKAADAAGYMILHKSDGEPVGDTTFYPTGPINSTTIVVMANDDGTLPDGMSQTQLQGLVQAHRANASHTSMSTTATASATVAPYSSAVWSVAQGSWSGAYNLGANIGWNSSARASYSFKTSCGCQQANGNGLGYYYGYLGSTYGLYSKWYWVGWSAGDWQSTTVPWGNITANRQFRAGCTLSNTFTCWGDAN
jgi:hypothetical protein